VAVISHEQFVAVTTEAAEMRGVSMDRVYTLAQGDGSSSLKSIE
jgi:hypothetical protein